MLQCRPTHSSSVIRSLGYEYAQRPVAARWQRRYTAHVMAVASPPSPAAQDNIAASSTAVKEENASRRAAPGSAFLALGVDPMLVDALPSINVTRPSPIQAAALPAILTGANCAVQSYTGSGKTLSYLLPALTLALRRAEAIAAEAANSRRGGIPDVPIQVLVVAPSQELAMQIVRVAKSLMPEEVRKYAVQQVIGGANPKRQAEALATKPGPLVVVGTPGRLAEMVRTGSLKLHRCPIMILDEADQLLAPAFAEDVNHLNDHCGKRLGGSSSHAAAAAATATQPTAASDVEPGSVGFEVVPSRRQTVLVSATLTPSVLSRAARLCADPRFVSAGAVPVLAPPEQEEGAEGQEAAGAGPKEKPTWGWGVRGWDGPASQVGPKTRGSVGGLEAEELIPTMPPQLQHYYLVAEPRHKVDTLRRAMHALGIQRALVFMNFQQRLQDAQYKLQARGMKAAALHGELPRLVRTNILNDFRRGRLRALVVSDVAARGIDVPECDAVFNLELPSSAAHYAHRAGRTGRLSAALAAQAAADAAAAAAAASAAATASEESGAEAVISPPSQQRPDRQRQEEYELMEDQAAGTVITVVAPNERFVVDKLAQHLGVPLQEAHVSHGQLWLGPPPAGYSFDRDTESDRADRPDDGKAGEAGARRERDRKGQTGERAELQAARRDTGAQASTSGRSAKVATSAAAASVPLPAEDSIKPKGGKRADDDGGGRFEVVIDEDDDIVLDDEDLDEQDEYDYEILDEDLEAFKRLRPSQVRKLAGSSAAGAAGDGAGGDAAVQLKAQRKKRVVLPGVEPGSGAKKAATGAAGAASSSSWRDEARGRKGKKRGGRQAGAGGDEEGDGQPRPRAVSRSELMEQMRQELEEIRAEKEKSRAAREEKNREKRRLLSEERW